LDLEFHGIDLVVSETACRSMDTSFLPVGAIDGDECSKKFITLTIVGYHIAEHFDGDDQRLITRHPSAIASTLMVKAPDPSQLSGYANSLQSRALLSIQSQQVDTTRKQERTRHIHKWWQRPSALGRRTTASSGGKNDASHAPTTTASSHGKLVNQSLQAINASF
jgi:hypothetical protein